MINITTGSFAILLVSIFISRASIRKYEAPVAATKASLFTVATPPVILIPLGGNTWARNNSGKQKVVTNTGIEHWTSNDLEFDTYFRISIAGTVSIKLRAKTDRESIVSVEINGIKRNVTIRGIDFSTFEAGEWTLKDSGYHKITLAAISKTGERFADISDYEISGTAIDQKVAFVKNNEGNFFYWGRRGPSVHLNYPFDDNIKASWFYNEITVPERQDVIGSYFMAVGFGEGYFGIQVNSATERRILFSVWSPFKTDDPKNIPQEKRITLLKKGEGVYTGEFGNEGSGGQSYLRYNWKAGSTYKFLLNGCPDVKGNTTYTAYFYAPEKNNWQLIASFKRPETTTYLKRFHSFLENFIPEQGNKERKAAYSNQWICVDNKNWKELTKATFTYDNTAAKGYRIDYAGGMENGHFFLKNCGFFNQYTPYKAVFERPAGNSKPTVDLNGLP